MKTGVYIIRNVVTNRKNDCYVGSAAGKYGIHGRINYEHIPDLRNNSHYNRRLQNAWNKYGPNAFLFEVLLYCDPENCLMYEQIAIDCFKPKYNLAPVAGSCLGIKHTKQYADKISKRHTGSKHPQAKLKEDEVIVILKRLMNTLDSAEEIAKDFNTTQANVIAISLGRSWKHVLSMLSPEEQLELEQMRSKRRYINYGSRNGKSKV